MKSKGPSASFPGPTARSGSAGWVELTAVNRRRDALYQDVFVGHPDNWMMGSFPKEGSIYNRIKGVVPTVKAVHLPVSAVGRFHCYIAIDKRVDGESKQAALIALGACDFVKHVVVVDSDIDPFREEEVLWAVATRVQANEDVDIIKNVKGATLDPSQRDEVQQRFAMGQFPQVGRRPELVPAKSQARLILEFAHVINGGNLNDARALHLLTLQAQVSL